MHPILFRIPLPKMPLKLWWALAAVAAIALIYAVINQRKGERSSAIFSAVVAIAAGVGGYYLRAKSFEAPHLPIYSYGVMLGLSLVVGWYLTLGLAKRDGLPNETMANCYVVTAIAAIAGSRLLYIATNLDEFKTFSDVFALRRGGLVAYGGFIGGFIGSWVFLARHRIKLMPWADVAVPSLASGLFITRIGCYLFGCDFGTALPEKAPAWLKKLGTFPHWPTGTLDSGDGSPAYVRHVELFRGTPKGNLVNSLDSSLPVHPTQIYESLIGLALLGLLLWQRKNQKFRGQIFFLFVISYGFARFLLEIIRDDVERGTYGPVMSEHVIVPGALLAFSLAFMFGVALGIKNPTTRLVARGLALVPPISAYLVLRPASFGDTVSVQLSTSQWLALITALICAYFYAKYWELARRSPKLAMATGFEASASDEDEDEEEDDDAVRADDDEDEEEDEAPKRAPAASRKKGLVKKSEKAASRDDEDDEDEDEASEPKVAAAKPSGTAKAAAEAKKEPKKDEPKAKEDESKGAGDPAPEPAEG
jgi:phosphatidylglycerol:prolipoprotein diacylglycerol transferase